MNKLKRFIHQEFKKLTGVGELQYQNESQAAQDQKFNVTVCHRCGGTKQLAKACLTNK